MVSQKSDIYIIVQCAECSRMYKSLELSIDNSVREDKVRQCHTTCLPHKVSGESKRFLIWTTLRSQPLLPLSTYILHLQFSLSFTEGVYLKVVGLVVVHV